MKKLLNSLLLVVIALTLMLSACAPAPAAPTQAPAASEPQEPAAQEPASPTKAPEPAAPTTAPAEEEPVDIELWAGGRVTEAAPPPDDWLAYTLLRDKLNINLNLDLLPSTLADQDTRINAAAASNSLPDLFLVNRDTWYKLVQAGLVAPVDDLLPLMPERTKTHYSDPIRNKLVILDGVMYGLADAGAMPKTDGLVIRQDWLDKLNLQAPKTLDEFMTVAKAFTFQDPDGNSKADTYGFCAFIDGTGLLNAGLGPRFDFIYGAYGVAGVWNLASSAEFGLNARNINTMKATQFVKSLVDEKVIDPDWPTLKKDEFRARWKQGTCGMMHENFAALSTQSNYKDFDTNFPDGEWAVLPPPAGPEGKSSLGITVATARIYAVSQRAIDAGKGPAIARLLEWMANEEGYYLLAFGIDGENYIKDSEGFISVKDVPAEKAWTSQEMQPFTQLANMVYIFSEVELKARYVSYTSQGGRPMDPLSYYYAFTEQPWTEATGAAVINPPANAADFVRFYSENIVNFVLGQQTLDEASWADYVAGLDSLGAKELEAAAKETCIELEFIK